MGGICSTPSEGDLQSSAVEKKMKGDAAQDQNIVKLLFLGAGGSGKITLFKQLKTIHGEGINERERSTYTDIVYHNIIDGIQTLCEKSLELPNTDPDLFSDCKISADMGKSAQVIMETREDSVVDEELADHIQKVWNDPGIQRTYLNRHLFQIQESIEYFCNKANLTRIAKSSYIPMVDDVLRVRLRTSGIVEQRFIIKGYEHSPFWWLTLEGRGMNVRNGYIVLMM